jgi:Ca2+-binding RTX toxin-like protein
MSRGRIAQLAAAVAVGGVLIGAQVASAATVEVVDGTLVFTAAPGEANDVRAGGLVFPGFETTHIQDLGAPLTAIGPGCVQLDAHDAVCPEEDRYSLRPLVVDTGGGDDQFHEDEANVRFVTIRTGPGNDTVAVGSSISIKGEVDGGPGDDTLSVYNNGGGSTVLHGDRGNDTLVLGEQEGGFLFGDKGNDHLIARYPGSFAPEVLNGGDGNDTYTFRQLYAVLAPGLIVPGRGFDTLDESDNTGRYGALTFDMNTCPKCVERVIGTQADDRITGDSNPQVIQGGEGDDVLDGGGGPDIIAGQDGDDTITSRDGMFDAVGCGAGLDAVLADRIDLVSRDCETVNRGATPGV